MEVLKEFTIPFVGLKSGKHVFSFTIDNTFFKHFDYTDFNKAYLKATLILEKKPNFLELSFKAIGQAKLQCDVSMELFDYPIETNLDLIVKFWNIS